MPPDGADVEDEVVTVGSAVVPTHSPGSVIVVEEDDDGLPIPAGTAVSAPPAASAAAPAADAGASTDSPRSASGERAGGDGTHMTEDEREAALRTLEELDSASMGTTQKVVLACVVVLIVLMVLYVLMYWGVIPDLWNLAQLGSTAYGLLLT